MNAKRAMRLYAAITDIREEWAEDALPAERVRRRPGLWAVAATAACICLVILGAFALGHIPGSGFGSSTGGIREHAPASPYLSYAGPVMPLTAEGEHETLTLTRRLELDLADFFERGTCRVTDAYTLENTGSREETVTLLYPVADSLQADPEKLRAIRVNGEAVEPELTVGPSVPEVRAEWTRYRDILEAGSFSLPDSAELLSRPVTVYELRDCWAEPETPAQAPTLSLEFTMEKEKSAVLTWGFHGGSDEPAAGKYSRTLSVPRPGQTGCGKSAYLIVLGKDVTPPVLRAYTNGACITPTEKAGGTLTRWESTLGEVLALCIRDMRGWEPDTTLEKRFTPEEAAAVCASFALEQGFWTARSYVSLVNYALEDILTHCVSWRRILLLRFTVTVPAGGSLEIAVETVKEASFDYASGFDSLMGFDALSARLSSLAMAEESAALRLPEAVECPYSDLAPEEGKLRYWADVKRKTLP